MRAKDKITELQNYLSELVEFMPKDFKEYLRDMKTKAACERYFEKIIEAAVDLAFIIIKDKGLKVPEDDKESFDVLADCFFCSRIAKCFLCVDIEYLF